MFQQKLPRVVYTQTDNDRDTVDVTTQTESDGDCVDASVQTDMDNESQTVMTQTEDLTLNGCSRAMCDIMSPMPGSRTYDSIPIGNILFVEARISLPAETTFKECQVY